MVNKFASHIFFSDMWGLIYRTRNRPIRFEDKRPLASNLYSETVSGQLDAAWKASQGGSSGSRLRRALWKCFCWQLISTLFLLFIGEASTIPLAVTLRLFLLSTSISTKWISGIAMICLVWLQSIAMRWYEELWRDLANRLVISIRGLMFRRLLTKSKVKHDESLVNNLTGDIIHIFVSCRSPYYIIISPVCFVATLILIAISYGWTALVGVPILLVFLLIGANSAKWGKRYLKDYFQTRDRCLNAIQQSISGIYTVKASQMELAILHLIENYRLKELWYLLRYHFAHGFQTSLFYLVKFPVTIAVLAAYLLTHSGALTASYIFPLLLLYSLIQDHCTYKLSHATAESLELKSCLNRLGTFMESETEKIVNEEAKTITTQIIQRPGTFYQIFGKTGSGKTKFAESLILALSDTKLIVAFSAEKPWLINATIRENILCGRPFDYDRYWETISACQLSVDLNKTRDGDQTQVGEDGVKLSGGQRARVAIARSVYSNADVYIFDDPFRALDKTVSSDVFQKVLINLLKNKTRILLGSKSHMSSKNCDKLYRIKRDVGLEELVNCIDYSNSDSGQSSIDEQKIHTIDAPGMVSESRVKPIAVEDHEDDTVTDEKEKLLKKNYDYRSQTNTFPNFFRYLGFAPVWLNCTTLIIVLLGQLATNLSDVWLYFWVTCNEACDQWFFFNIYLGIAAVALALCFARVVLLRYFGYVVAKNMYNQLAEKVFYAPMEFFWNAKRGEILNWFSSDMFNVDYPIPIYIDVAVQSLMAVLGFMVIIGCLFSTVLVCLVPVLLVVVLIMMFTIRIGKEMGIHEVESVARIVQKFSSIASGLVTIKAFRLESYVGSSLFTLMDFNSISRISFLRCETFVINAVLMSCSAFISFAVIMITVKGGDSAAAGLLFFYAINLLIQCRISVFANYKLSSLMVHFDRVLGQLGVKTERDSNFNVFGKQSLSSAGMRKYTKDENNCSEVKNISMDGIEATQVSVQYTANDKWAIKDVNMTLPGGKVTGVAGRSGCGKSTFLSALLRIVNFEGTIRVGERDSSSMSLAELRSCFAMLPQDSMIFYQETVRWNLDPYTRCSEEVIWDTLDVIGIKYAIIRLSMGLETLLKDAGLSSGETRLFCFARVLLNSHGKILLLDEPTDSVDFETEKIIWEAIRKKLQHRTILVVAHSRRLLKRCDQIIKLAED